MEALVRSARGATDYEACVALQREVWGLTDLEITSAIQLIVTVHAGGLLLVAEAGEAGIVGFCCALAALRGGESQLHSDMLAVRPSWRGRGVGLALKWAQREEALRRGLRLVTWTFDPMRAPNARLNLHRLGALSRELLPDLYGTTSSPLHHGLATDRLLARWEIASPRVGRRAAGEAPPADRRMLPAVHDVRWASDLPVPGSPRLDVDEERLWLEIPPDWDAVCRADVELARAWQQVARNALQALFARGYAAVDCTRDQEGARRRTGYVLRRSSSSSPVATGSEGSDDHSLHEPA